MLAPSAQSLRALRATEVIHNSSHLLPSFHHPRSFLCAYRCLYFRCLTTSSLRKTPPPPSKPPPSTDRGPKSAEETQTNFDTMDVFSNVTAPTNSIDACLSNGFHLGNGVKIIDGSGLLLIGGEAFSWRPWESNAKRKMRNGQGQWDAGEGAWGLLRIVWPKPEMLILGLGSSMLPVAPGTRKLINDLGIRLDVQDTRNAAAQFNLLATERGVGDVAAALIPFGWREPG